jgi:hypothetical protein
VDSFAGPPFARKQVALVISWLAMPALGLESSHRGCRAKPPTIAFGGVSFLLSRSVTLDSWNLFGDLSMVPIGDVRVLRSIREWLETASWRMEHVFAP